MEFPWKVADLEQNVLEKHLQGMPQAGLCVTGLGLSLAESQHPV